MNRMIWAALMTTVLAAPAFAQDKSAKASNHTSATTTTTSNKTVDLQGDEQKVQQDKAALKADRAAGNTAAMQKDRTLLKTDRAALHAAQKRAGITPTHHKKTANNAPSGSASHHTAQNSATISK